MGGGWGLDLGVMEGCGSAGVEFNSGVWGGGARIRGTYIVFSLLFRKRNDVTIENHHCCV